jgi:hypothetical protein
MIEIETAIEELSLPFETRDSEEILNKINSLAKIVYTLEAEMETIIFTVEEFESLEKYTKGLKQQIIALKWALNLL